MRIDKGGYYGDNPVGKLLDWLGAYEGVTSANGNAGGTTLVCADLANHAQYTNALVKVLDGAAAGQTLPVVSDVAGTVTVAGFTDSAGAAVQIVAGTRFIILTTTNMAAILAILAGLTVPAIGSAANVLERDVIGNKADQPNFNTSNASIVYSLMSWIRGLARERIVQLGNAQAGSTASLLVDAGNLNQGAGYWPGQKVLMTSGVNIGLSRPILTFNNVTNTVALDPPFPFAIGVGDAYIITSDYTPVGLAQIVAAIRAVTDAEAVLSEVGGTIATDGAEQDIYLNNAPLGLYRPVCLKIDFTNQTAGETVEIRIKYRIINGGGLIVQTLTTIAGIPATLLQSWTLEPNRWGVEITITRTAGVSRNYNWEVTYED